MAQDELRYRVTADTKQFEAGMGRVESRLRKTQGGTRRQSQAFTQLAYAMDDAQYGFRGVQNNLQQIAVTAGASGPVVLGITAIIIALNYGIENWDKFGDTAAKQLDSISDKVKENQEAVANLVLAQSALEGFDSDGKLLEREKARAKAAALHAVFQTSVKDLLQDQLDIQEDIERIEAGGSASTWQLIKATWEDVANTLSGKGGGANLNQLALNQLKKDSEKNSKDIESTISRFSKNIKEILKDFPELSSIFNLGTEGTGGRAKVSLVNELTPSGTSLEELKKWQKDATRLMKSFAHAWDLEWKNVGKITVAGGDEVADAIRQTRDKLGHNLTETTTDVTNSGQAFQSAVAGAFSGLGSAIGEALAGEGNIGEKFLRVLGTFMTQFGSALIALGIAEAAWLSSFDPATKIAAGAALVIAGAAISASYSKKPGSSGGGGSSYSASQVSAAASIAPTIESGRATGSRGLRGSTTRGEDIRYNQQVALDNYQAYS